jgi:threonyl-tRNA synthetase
MPDCHAFCTDLNQAKTEFEKRFKLSIEILNEIGLTKEDYEIALRFTKDFYEENRTFIKKLARIYSEPILVELWKDRFFYFALKWDANFIDNQKKAAALSTDQIDVENAKRYKITYVDNKGEKKNPLILHFSPSGAIERVVYALLEKAYKNQQKGKSPMLPIWLSPTQVRLIPISEGYLEKVAVIAKNITQHNIRVDIDDRASTLQKKVRDAEKEWVPYIIVIGPKEIDSGVLSVRNRKNNRKVEKIELSQLIEKIKIELKNKPHKDIALPKKLSHRPQFYG